MEIILKLSDNKTELYNSLFNKYLGYVFNDEKEEKEFLMHLKNLLNEDEKEIEFEAKIMFINGLTEIVNLKKFGLCYNTPSPVSK